MMGAPYDYTTINLATSMKTPNSVHCKNSYIVSYFTRYLFNKLISVFDFKNLPKTWDKDYFIYNLYKSGFVTVFNTDRFGVIPQACSLSGINVFYRPTYCIVSNPLIRNVNQIVIGKDCELIRITPDYRGIMDIVSLYADMMGLAMESVAVSLVNSKVAYVFKADNKASAETLKKMYDTISSGEPAVFIDKELSNDGATRQMDMFNTSVKNNYITDNLLNDLRTIENMFCTEIGIPNTNYNKKERLITDEVNANRVETYSNTAVWLDCLQKSIEKVNSMFNLNISVDYKFTMKGGIESGMGFNSDNI